MLTGLTSLLTTYGYILVFFLILLESAGLPLPGESLLILAAAFASSGHLSIFGVIISAVLGAILGDMGGYWIGRRGGPVVLRRILGSQYDEHLTRGRAFFERHGAWAVFLARFVPIVRVVGANLAGITEMPFSTFTLFNATGGLAWAVAMGSLGYIFGNNLPYLESLLRRLGAGVFIAVCTVALAIWVSRQMSNHKAKVRAWLHHIKQAVGLRRLQTWLVNQHQFKQIIVMNLGLGLFLAIFSGWIFGVLAEDVLTHDSMTLYDAGISRWILSLATEDGSQFFYLITLLGSSRFIAITSLLMSAWLVWRKRWLQVATFVLTVGGGTLLNVLLKNIFLRPRPDFPNAFYLESGYSFPSGHAMLSILLYGMTAYLIASQTPSWKIQIRLWITAVTVSLLIGFSRIFLGVHYLTDVLGGWAAGIVWLVVCMGTYKLAQHSQIKILNNS